MIGVSDRSAADSDLVSAVLPEAKPIDSSRRRRGRRGPGGGRAYVIYNIAHRSGKITLPSPSLTHQHRHVAIHLHSLQHQHRHVATQPPTKTSPLLDITIFSVLQPCLRYAAKHSYRYARDGLGCNPRTILRWAQSRALVRQRCATKKIVVFLGETKVSLLLTHRCLWVRGAIV